MDVDENEEKKMEVDEKKEDKKEEPEQKLEKKEEPVFEILSNPARVMKAQLKVITPEDAKYTPMKDIKIGGIVMLNNVTGEKEEIVEPMAVNKGATEEDEGTEPEPPQPFLYTED